MKIKCCILLLYIFATIAGSQNCAATEFKKESLEYEIVYHWGLIWKHAASATLNIEPQGSKYNASLTARTRSWADKLYRVRDTLKCTMQKEGLRPLQYIKIKNEGSDIGTDVLQYTYTPDSIFADCKRYRRKNGHTHITLSTTGTAYDMLSVFYYLRTLDFDKRKSGEVITTSLFSGRRKEILTIKFVGRDQVELRDKSVHDAYHIKLTFAEEGKPDKSSDDIDAWFSIDESHIPLYVLGKVAIGEVRVYYKAK